MSTASSSNCRCQVTETEASGFDEREILDAIDPHKDVDAFSPVNVGLLMQGRPRFLPCTPHGIVQLLHRSKISVAGKHVVVVGRSDIVGKPMAMMLAQRDGSCGRDMSPMQPSRSPTVARKIWQRSAGAPIV